MNPKPKTGHAPGVQLHYAFEPGEQRGAEMGNALFELLGAVFDGGSIRHAAQILGCSYRHAWGALKRWEQMLGEPLVVWSQGQRARPTEFAERLLWAERRARTRMQPHIEALRADLARVLADARDERQQLLTVRASHDIALPVLQQHAAEAAALHLDIRFQGSVDSLRALNDRQCLVAGFHVPALRGAAPVFAKALKPLLKPGLHKLIGCSRRTQGLMLRREHAGLIRGFADLAHHPMRFANRQSGSGTRMLIDHLMQEHALDPHALRGYAEHTEDTHVAVAACIASGLADVGVGIESAAIEFGLHFVPLVEEDYFLACLKPDLEHPAVLRLREVLAGAAWRDVLAHVPGYRPAAAPGKVLVMTAALPWWRYAKAKAHHATKPAADADSPVPTTSS
ncbi:MAG TPA: substrate-binding domain-containing protein [Burkholderiaceae bacterium]